MHPLGPATAVGADTIPVPARYLDSARGALRQYAAVSSHSAVASAARYSLDIRRFPWVSRLAADYASADARLSGFFDGHPTDPAAWRAAIARAQAHARPLAAVADLLAAQQRDREAPRAAIGAAAELRAHGTVAVVTGQQAGLFGGPLFTLLKALTAIRLATRVRAEHGVAAVPVFWIEAEDHDWAEVRECGVMDGEMTEHRVSLGDPPGAHIGPVAQVRLDATAEAAIADLARWLPPTEHSAALIARLGAIYRPGVGMARAFAQWLESVLGPLGLVVYDASDPAAKPLVADLFAAELAHPGRTSRLAAEAGAALQTHGYHAQITPQADAVALFEIGSGRTPIRLAGDGFSIGDRHCERSRLAEQAAREPERFSPGVLLRPLVQDTLFPTVCYVAGPSELAYLGQLRGVYAAFGVPMPLVQPRATATLVDANAMRFLQRHEIPLESLQPQDEGALNQLLQAQMPPSLTASHEAAAMAIQERMDALACEVARVDATLEGATRSTLGRMQDDLKKLQAKVIQAVKRKDDTLRRQFLHARSQAFPGGHPQEREVGFVCHLNKYGPDLLRRLDEELPLDMGRHWVITI